VINRRTLLRSGAAAATALAAGAGATGMAAMTRQGIDWTRLSRSIRGDLVLPGNTGYDQARLSDFSQFDHIRPQAVAFCETTQDVQAAVRFARQHDVHTAVRSGGHSFAGYSTGSGLILDVSRLNQTTFGAGTVRLGPGVQNVDAQAAGTARGVALVGGLCPTVCAGGFLQGGGIGWLTRNFGMAADHVVGAEVVLADGSAVRCSAQQHPDLFWALRGGSGGNFGVVTSFEVTPVSAPRMVNYNLTWPWASAASVIEAWQDWIVGSDRKLGGELTLLWPDSGTGEPQVMVYGGYLGAQGALDGLLAELELAVGQPPATKDVQDLPYDDAMMQWYGCAEFTVDECHRVGYLPDAKIPRQNFFVDRNRFVNQTIPAAGVADLVSAFTDRPRAGQFRVLALFASGGAVNDVPRTATAYVHRSSELLAHYAVALNDPAATEDDRTAARNWISAGFTTLDRHANEESYQNFTDPLLTDWRSAFYAENYGRLIAVKRNYDPDRFFRFAQAID
jgi:FAD/FMN-containing dehydrogenase